MSIDQLWAGWRASYIERAASASGGTGDGSCVFCALAASTDDAEAYVLERTELTYTVLNLYPYTTGHLLVVPVRHEGQFEALDAAEGPALFAALQRGIVAVRAAMSPDAVNIGANLGRAAGAGIPDHCHLHAVPRWTGDTNFMTSIAEARVLPEDLRTTWKRLRDVWPDA